MQSYKNITTFKEGGLSSLNQTPTCENMQVFFCYLPGFWEFLPFLKENWWRITNSVLFTSGQYIKGAEACELVSIEASIILTSESHPTGCNFQVHG